MNPQRQGQSAPCRQRQMAGQREEETDGRTPSSYQLRKNLEYIPAKPRFLQNILRGQDDLARAREHQARERFNQRLEENEEELPVMVDSEGNPLPGRAPESDVQLDLAFSDIPSEPDQSRGAAGGTGEETEAVVESAKKKARLAAVRKLGKVSTNPRMLSFDTGEAE